MASSFAVARAREAFNGALEARIRAGADPEGHVTRTLQRISDEIAAAKRAPKDPQVVGRARIGLAHKTGARSRRATTNSYEWIADADPEVIDGIVASRVSPFVFYSGQRVVVVPAARAAKIATRTSPVFGTLGAAVLGTPVFYTVRFDDGTMRNYSETELLTLEEAKVVREDVDYYSSKAAPPPTLRGGAEIAAAIASCGGDDAAWAIVQEAHEWMDTAAPDDVPAKEVVRTIQSSLCKIGYNTDDSQAWQHAKLLQDRVGIA